MPELPDIEAYCVALNREIVDSSLQWLRILHPFLLRSVGVDPNRAEGHPVRAVHRYGKRIGIEFENDIVFVFHLMIAGRFRWEASPAPAAKSRGRPSAKSGRLAELGFENGVLVLTEAGSKRRASLHVVAGAPAAAAMDRGGVEVLDPATTADDFTRALQTENHTVKRALTDPRLFSGIGNSYSDEILFAARLSPFAMTQSLSDADAVRLHEAARGVLTEWTDRSVSEARVSFPSRVTAFRKEMHVHGKYGQPCDVCSTPVQRIRYAENECNYCPSCQTGGKIYADRALSRLLKNDWPRTVEELERLNRPPGS